MMASSAQRTIWSDYERSCTHAREYRLPSPGQIRQYGLKLGNFFFFLNKSGSKMETPGKVLQMKHRLNF